MKLRMRTVKGLRKRKKRTKKERRMKTY